MKLLFISNWYPYPANNGSKLRVYNLLQGLATRHEVTLVSFTHENDRADADTLQPLCREIHRIPFKPFQPASRRAWAGFLHSMPRSLVDTYVPEMAQCIRQTLDSAAYDLVIASQLGAARYSECFKPVPALFEEVELGVLYQQYAAATSMRRRLRHGLTWMKHRRYLEQLLDNYAACTVASEEERRLMAQAVPTYRSVELVPNCVNLADYAAVHETPQPNSLIFTGSFRYFANHEAMIWFLGKVYPHIQAQVPDVHLTITGDHADLPLPPAGNVTLTGLVDSVLPLISRAWCSVVPIQSGGGTRLKILEAMALGTPVVTTSKGAEGLGAEPGRHLLVADTPQEFAAVVVRLLTTPGLRDHLADAAYTLVRERYDWRATLPRFLDLLDRVVAAA